MNPSTKETTEKSDSADDGKEDFDDLSLMEELHESLILHNFKRRFQKDVIYTYIGPMVVSINPFKVIQSYGEHVIPLYLNAKSPEGLPPHLYAVGQQAYQNMLAGRESQSVIITGESGAGKTEATKIVLNFLTYAAKQADSSNKVSQDLAQKILATNPILEAFGNAKTVRNNNSSRFGKFIKIIFDGPTIIGAKIDNYLLEKTRIIFQAKTERNYHIFYHLLRGANAEQAMKYKLLACDKYSYLSNGSIMIEDEDDKEQLNEVITSLKSLGFSQADVDQIFLILSGILLLGNINFVGEETVSFSDDNIVDMFIELWGVNKEIARNALLGRNMTVGKSTSFIPFKLPQAIENRDALAKAVYASLFNWLVLRLNTQLTSSGTVSSSIFIGVLDIYGFEIFENNSVEQFMINYANEKLHQQFNEHMFKVEQEDYKKEGVAWTDIQFKDNTVCVDLIEKHGRGLLSLLDEECKVPKGNDAGFLEKANKQHSRNTAFEKDTKNPLEFKIGHFAGNVSYNITGFVEKNRDTLFADCVSCILSSNRQVLLEAWNTSIDKTKLSLSTETANRPTGTNKETLTSSFKQDLHILVSTLSASSRHYVRCIKPNESKLPSAFDEPKVMSQLACNGVLETVKIRKQGFSYRLTLERWLDRFYACLAHAPAGTDLKDTIHKYLSSLSLEREWSMGHTKVFMRDAVVKKLTEIQTEARVVNAIIFQKYVRRSLCMEQLRRRVELREAATKLQGFILRHIAENTLTQLRDERTYKLKCYTFLQCVMRRKLAEDALALLRLQYNSARALQNRIRSHHAYKLYLDYKELNDASIVLTKYFRRHMAMNQLAELQWLADEENRRRLRHQEEDKQREEIRKSLDEAAQKAREEKEAELRERIAAFEAKEKEANENRAKEEQESAEKRQKLDAELSETRRKQEEELTARASAVTEKENEASETRKKQDEEAANRRTKEEEAWNEKMKVVQDELNVLSGERDKMTAELKLREEEMKQLVADIASKREEASQPPQSSAKVEVVKVPEVVVEKVSVPSASSVDEGALRLQIEKELRVQFERERNQWQAEQRKRLDSEFAEKLAQAERALPVSHEPTTTVQAAQPIVQQVIVTQPGERVMVPMTEAERRDIEDAIRKEVESELSAKYERLMKRQADDLNSASRTLLSPRGNRESSVQQQDDLENKRRELENKIALEEDRFNKMLLVNEDKERAMQRKVDELTKKLEEVSKKKELDDEEIAHAKLKFKEKEEKRLQREKLAKEKWQEEERKFEARMREREKSEQQFRDNWVLEEMRLNNLIKEKERQTTSYDTMERSMSMNDKIKERERKKEQERLEEEERAFEEERKERKKKLSVVKTTSLRGLESSGTRDRLESRTPRTARGERDRRNDEF